MGSQLVQIRHDQKAILCEDGANLGGAGIGIDVKGLGRAGIVCDVVVHRDFGIRGRMKGKCIMCKYCQDQQSG